MKELQIYHITTKSIVFIDGKLLLVPSGDKDRPNDYEFPGGRIDKGEDVYATLRRELQEELGLQVDTHTKDYELFDINFRSVEEYGYDGTTSVLELYFTVPIDDATESDLVMGDENDKYLLVDNVAEADGISTRNSYHKELIKRLVK